jgi:hypothetical protein
MPRRSLAKFLGDLMNVESVGRVGRGGGVVKGLGGGCKTTNGVIRCPGGISRTRK